jgi:para-aminobenzoate synthetase / 4-amino-4-deoxychorismate lyase
MPMRKIFLKKILSKLSRDDNFVFLETNKPDTGDRFSYLFTSPLNIIACYNSKLLKPSIEKIEAVLKKGYFAAGFISYEAGIVFEKTFAPRKFDFPLLWFGVFEKPIIFNHEKIEFKGCDDSKGCKVNNLRPDVSEIDYIHSVEKIKKYIEQGHTYQVNRTFKLHFDLAGSLQDLYLCLRNKQGVAYSAFIKFQKYAVLSFSPELFFKKEKNNIMVKPMKGTIARGRFPAEDLKNADSLYNCPKNRSENIMIVDLMRNDLGRICNPGAVRTKKLFEIEKYESLWQMTSTVEGSIRPKVPLYEIFQSMFPSGSVTGAPKISTMRIIDELEKTPRDIYTGSIGFFSPEMDSVFNVAIRTLLVDTAKRKGEMGVGSGIVYDSNPKKEYEECLLKAKFLTDKAKRFSLVETMLWEPVKGCALVKFHLQRLKKSAEYFNYEYDEPRIISNLNNISAAFNKHKKYRIRLLLNERGIVNINYQILREDNTPKMVAVSSVRTDSADKWLYFKTTNRSLYDSEYRRYKKRGFFDVVFENEKNQITEGAISNIFIAKNGIYYTPPVECGVLDGVCRRRVLSEGKIKAQEKIIYYDDLLTADRIFLCNAVRGIVVVELGSVDTNGVCVKRECASV